MIGKSFFEVNRRRRSRRGIRKNFSQSSDRIRTLDASVYFYSSQNFGVSKCHWGLNFKSLRLTTLLERLHNRRILVITDTRDPGPIEKPSPQQHH